MYMVSGFKIDNGGHAEMCIELIVQNLRTW